MNFLKSLNQVFQVIANWGTILFMGVIAVVIPYEVIGRYVFASMSTWSGEVSTYSLVWASMMGGAAGLKKGYQVSMTSVLEAVPEATARTLKFVAYLCTMFFFAVMFYYGLFQTIYNINQVSPAIGLTLTVPYAAMPLGFLIMFSFTLEEFLVFLGQAKKGGDQC